MRSPLAQMQYEHSDWRRRNFPGQQPYQALLGAMEELGELAHAHLKAEQGIRLYTDGLMSTAFLEAATDAVADLFIFLAGYCNAVGIDMEQAILETWDKVKQRDWVADPEGGNHA